jgi:hypothetical protein
MILELHRIHNNVTKDNIFIQFRRLQANFFYKLFPVMLVLLQWPALNIASDQARFRTTHRVPFTVTHVFQVSVLPSGRLVIAGCVLN